MQDLNSKKTLNSALIIGDWSLLREAIVSDLKHAGLEVTLLNPIEASSVNEQQISSSDVAVNLAFLNSRSATPQELSKVNFEIPFELASKLFSSNLVKYVNVTSTHIRDGLHESAYVVHRTKLSEDLKAKYNNRATNIYRAVMHDNHQILGRLSFLNYFPTIVRRPLLSIARSMVATSSIEAVSRAILDEVYLGSGEERIITDNKSNDVVFKSLKRFLDYSFAVAVLILLWWLLGLIWLSVKLTSDGPGFFFQKRVGRHGKIFNCIKFRTMKVGTKSVGTHEVNRSSITKVGRFLRRTKLDELPQIWNLLRGDMSLVGPRPCLPNQTELVLARKKRNVLSIRPGITGLAQIHNIDMSTPELLAEWDERYLKLRSILLDINILKLTLLGRGQGDKTKIKQQ